MLDRIDGIYFKPLVPQEHRGAVRKISVKSWIGPPLLDWAAVLQASALPDGNLDKQFYISFYG